MSQLRVPRQIIWAVDAFEPPESPLIRSAANWISSLIRDFGTLNSLVRLSSAGFRM